MAGQFDIRRRVTAEAIGTAFLVTAVVGSGIMADAMTGDSALALLANTSATACALFVLITILGPISGAHLNPAVSLVMALFRELSPRECAAYAVAQFAGGIAGTFLAHAMFDRPIFELSLKARSGEAQWFSEGVATFGLIFVILAGLRLARGSVAALVALYIAAAYWFTPRRPLQIQPSRSHAPSPTASPVFVRLMSRHSWWPNSPVRWLLLHFVRGFWPKHSQRQSRGKVRADSCGKCRGRQCLR